MGVEHRHLFIFIMALALFLLAFGAFVQPEPCPRYQAELDCDWNDGRLLPYCEWHCIRR